MRLRLPKTRAKVRRDAQYWVARLRGPDAAQLQPRFRRWYEADPSHAAAFEAVSRRFEQSGLARQSSYATARSLGRVSSNNTLQPRLALAAAAAIVLLIPAGLLLSEQGLGPFENADTLLVATSVGQIRVVRLADGSKLTLDTNSAVKIELTPSERRAVLKRGRARFVVAADPRPFVVQAGCDDVTVERAVVDVDRLSGAPRVFLLSGAASVAAKRNDTRMSFVLKPGEGVAEADSGVFAKVPVQVSPDWTRGMLQFEATPLGEAVQLADRYSTQKIIVADNLKSLRLTGAYRAGDTSGFARSLAAAFHLTLEHTATGDLLLSSQRSATAQKKKVR